VSGCEIITGLYVHERQEFAFNAFVDFTPVKRMHCHMTDMSH